MLHGVSLVFRSLQMQQRQQREQFHVLLNQPSQITSTKMKMKRKREQKNGPLVSEKETKIYSFQTKFVQITNTHLHDKYTNVTTITGGVAH